MDWFFKTNSWDFGEFQPEADPRVCSSEELNNSSLKKKGECSVDLKLGRIGDSIDGILNAWSSPQSGAKASQSNPPKRARKVVTANQNVSCSVDGCKSDLSGCRDYHKRHKVCEVHAKTPIVTVGGLQQRFCQQCSRFHLLKEFDEIKRSCRKRLDGHNRRRRKVQPDAESANSASFLHGHYPVSGGFSLSPQTWVGNRQNAAWLGTSSSQHQPSINYLEQQPLFPLYSGNQRLSSSYQPHPNRITSSDSNRALSLLSLSNPSLDMNAVHAGQAETISMAHHLNHPKCFTSSGSGRDLCTGKSCSQVSNCISTSILPSTERENQLENTNLVSAGVGVVPCDLTFDIAGAQTEPVYSPPSHGLPVFWPT